ncbi:hypothetical protein [Dysgonomonas sp. BGC7]|uniref:hypothetical protein n=1 Tax=Dysgonomonas sp. BGC7 TaxID=1658008 RepID=UPI000682E9F9|nr:hypothetical protein [Dysgonomonas sp. BGC7]MBD8387774.1 hypothetical protein [Dysgonomonas sp. BGC7]
MKKIYLFWTCCLAMLLLAGCDTDGDGIDQSFTSYSLKVISPVHFDDLKNITATIDGENITNALFKGRDERKGRLKVSYLDYAPIEQDVILQPGTTLQLLLQPGKVIELYDEKNYISFTGSFILNEGYTAKLNGQELVQGLNYIRNEKTQGDLKFYKEGEATPIATISDINLAQDTNLNVMQLSDEEFIKIPVDDEPEPTSNKILKARFLYLGDEVLSMDELRIDFYILNQWSYEFISNLVGSITIEKGKLSEYIKLDTSFREPDLNAGDSEDSYGYSFLYEIVDPSTGNILVDHSSYSTYVDLSGEMTADGGMSWTYKKAAFIFKSNGNECMLQKGLSTSW